MRCKEDLLVSVPGVGPAIARTLDAPVRTREGQRFYWRRKDERARRPLHGRARGRSPRPRSQGFPPMPRRRRQTEVRVRRAGQGRKPRKRGRVSAGLEAIGGCGHNPIMQIDLDKQDSRSPLPAAKRPLKNLTKSLQAQTGVALAAVISRRYCSVVITGNEIASIDLRRRWLLEASKFPRRPSANACETAGNPQRLPKCLRIDFYARESIMSLQFMGSLEDGMIGSAAAEKRDDQGGVKLVVAPATRKLSPGLRALVARTNYEAPKVVAFPMAGMNATTITMAGQT